jgi:hypothetical protein
MNDDKKTEMDGVLEFSHRLMAALKNEGINPDKIADKLVSKKFANLDRVTINGIDIIKHNQTYYLADETNNIDIVLWIISCLACFVVFPILANSQIGIGFQEMMQGLTGALWPIISILCFVAVIALGVISFVMLIVEIAKSR